MKNIVQIIPQLFLGNIFATSPEILRNYKITHIINLSGTQYSTKADCLVLPIDDHPLAAKQMLMDVIPRAHSYITNNMKISSNNILVHCMAGKSRSVTVIIAYLMNKYMLSFHDAYQYVYQRKPDIMVNNGFVRILQTFV